MKKTILLLLIGLVLQAKGQITYTAANYAGQDSSYILSKSNSASLNTMNFGDTGANQTWNCAGITVSSQTQQQYVSPDNTGYFTGFMASCVGSGTNFLECMNIWTYQTTLAKPNPEELNLGSIAFSNATDFYNKKTNGLINTFVGVTYESASGSFPLVFIYDQPDTLYHFPINYGRKDTCISAYTIDLTSIGTDFIYKKRLIRQTAVDAYGTLTTPLKNYSSVLKHTAIIDNYDTMIYSGTTIPTHTIKVIYSFFDAQHGIPVLQVEGNKIGPVTTLTGATFIDTLRCITPNAMFVYYPFTVYLDSATNEAEVGFTNLSTNADTYSWDFGDPASGSNNTSTLKNPTHIYNTAGTYTVQLKSYNSICSNLTYDSTSWEIDVIDTSGVRITEINNGKEYLLSPNPCKEMLKISSLYDNSKSVNIEIINNLGITVFKQNIIFNNSEKLLNLSPLPAGSYTVRIFCSNRVSQHRLIKY